MTGFWINWVILFYTLDIFNAEGSFPCLKDLFTIVAGGSFLEQYFIAIEGTSSTLHESLYLREAITLFTSRLLVGEKLFSSLLSRKMGIGCAVRVVLSWFMLFFNVETAISEKKILMFSEITLGFSVMFPSVLLSISVFSLFLECFQCYWHPMEPLIYCQSL